MLKFLKIQNLALIDTMELEFTKGLNVLTGETGAGKSFIIKAINFVLGDKLLSNMVRAGCEKAQVEAIFIIQEKELFLRRELLAKTGRSRLYINNKLSSQESVRELRSSLILHTSQHGQQRLLQPAYQAQLVDTTLPNTELLQQKNTLIQELHTVADKRKKLQEKYKSLAERRELLEMQQHAIDKVAPEYGEEDRLEAQRAEARAISLQADYYEQALKIVYGEDGISLMDILSRLERVLEEICTYDAGMEADLEALSALRQNIPHLEARLRKAPQASSLDMDALEARLYALAQLKRKLHRSLDDILQLRTEIEENISFLDSCNLDIKALLKEEQSIAKQLTAVLEQLIPLRRTSAINFSQNLEKTLINLGFSKDLKVIVDFSPQELWQDIFDEKARLLWAPNPGQEAQPLDKIASGGELSRFLLALVSTKADAESVTYIFDEVDAGVGGMTLNKLAEHIKSLAQYRQILLITHWPQLAALGKQHFHVHKQEREGKTYTLCQHVEAAERDAELLRMAGGSEQSMFWGKEH